MSEIIDPPLLALNEPAGHKRNCGIAEAHSELAQTFLGDDGVPMLAEQVLEGCSGGVHPLHADAAREAAELGGVAYALDADPQRVQLLVARIWTQLAHLCEQASELTGGQRGQRPCRRLWRDDDRALELGKQRAVVVAVKQRRQLALKRSPILFKLLEQPRDRRGVRCTQPLSLLAEALAEDVEVAGRATDLPKPAQRALEIGRPVVRDQPPGGSQGSPSSAAGDAQLV